MLVAVAVVEAVELAVRTVESPAYSIVMFLIISSLSLTGGPAVQSMFPFDL